MPYIVCTRTSGNRFWYLTRTRAPATTNVELAHRYGTANKAYHALHSKRLRSDIDSAWHHGWIEYTPPVEGEALTS